MLWIRPALICLLLVASAILNSAQTQPVRLASPKTSTSAASMRQIVEKFYRLRERTLDERGTKDDVEKLIALLAPAASYEHPVPNVRMTVAQAREGLTAHLNEGKRAKITLGPIRTGSNFAVVEVDLQYEVAGRPIAKRGITVFEFTRGKISRVAEY